MLVCIDHEKDQRTRALTEGLCRQDTSNRPATCTASKVPGKREKLEAGEGDPEGED